MKAFNIIKFIPFFCLLFLASLNCIGRGPVFFFAACLYGLLLVAFNGANKGTMKGAKIWPFVCLTITAIIGAIFNYDTKEIIKPICFGLSYVLGYKIYQQSANKHKMVFFISLSLMLGFLAYVAMLYYTNQYILGHAIGNRNIIDFWKGEPTPGTLAGLLCSFPIAISYYCLFGKNGVLLKGLGLVSILLTILINNMTATRTPYVLFALIYSIMLFNSIKNNKKSIKYIVVGVSALVFIYMFNLWSIQDIIGESTVFERMNEEGFKTSRTDVALYYFSILFDYPLGGEHGENVIGFTPHNLFQEMQYEFGILPFIFSIFIGVFIFKQILFFFKYKSSDYTIVLIFSVIIALYAQCFLEPVYIGYPQLPWILFIYSGIAQCQINEIKSSKVAQTPNSSIV